MAGSISRQVLHSICLLLLFSGFIGPQHLFPSTLCLQQQPINSVQCAFKAERLPLALEEILVGPVGIKFSGEV